MAHKKNSNSSNNSSNNEARVLLVSIMLFKIEKKFKNHAFVALFVLTHRTFYGVWRGSRIERKDSCLGFIPILLKTGKLLLLEKNTNRIKLSIDPKQIDSFSHCLFVFGKRFALSPLPPLLPPLPSPSSLEIQVWGLAGPPLRFHSWIRG